MDTSAVTCCSRASALPMGRIVTAPERERFRDDAPAVLRRNEEEGVVLHLARQAGADLVSGQEGERVGRLARRPRVEAEGRSALVVLRKHPVEAVQRPLGALRIVLEPAVDRLHQNGLPGPVRAVEEDQLVGASAVRRGADEPVDLVLDGLLPVDPPGAFAEVLVEEAVAAGGALRNRHLLLVEVLDHGRHVLGCRPPEGHRVREEVLEPGVEGQEPVRVAEVVLHAAGDGLDRFAWIHGPILFAGTRPRGGKAVKRGRGAGR